MTVLQAFLADPAGLAVKGMLVAAFLDFAFGVYAAGADHSFSWDVLAAFVGKHFLKRIAPIGTLLFVGYVSHDMYMTGAGGVAAAAYTAETLASIYGSIRPPAESVAKQTAAVEAGNPIPTD
jgi:hypothetical protein